MANLDALFAAFDWNMARFHETRSNRDENRYRRNCLAIADQIGFTPDFPKKRSAGVMSDALTRAFGEAA